MRQKPRMQVEATVQSNDCTYEALDLIALSSQINVIQMSPCSAEKTTSSIAGIVKRLSFERKPRSSQAGREVAADTDRGGASIVKRLSFERKPRPPPQQEAAEDAATPSTNAPRVRRFSFAKQPKAQEGLHSAQVPASNETSGSSGAISFLVRRLSFSKQKRDSGRNAVSDGPAPRPIRSAKKAAHPLAAGAFPKLPLDQVPPTPSSGSEDTEASSSESDRSPRLSLTEFEILISGGRSSVPPPPPS